MVDYSCLFEVPAMSRVDLRQIAKKLRDILQIETPCFPIEGLLECMHLLVGVDYDIIDDMTWGVSYGNNVHAQYDLDQKCICVKESVYLRACDGCGRDRFTIAHEIAHAILIRDNRIKFCRSEKDPIPLYKNPEWQADCLAGELLVPYDLCRNMSVETIAKKCMVSFSAAKTQKKAMNKYIN